MNTLFPIFLKLEKLNLLIVGGGYVGIEKLEAVLRNSPNTKIKLVAPEIRPEITELASTHNCELIYDKYKSDYLADIDIVIAGTSLKEVNKQVWQDCQARKILINVADTPDLCDFYLSSVVIKDDLKIAISTNGKSPTFAKRFREILEDLLPNSIQEVLENLNEIRNKLKGDFESKVDKLNEITRVMKNKE